MTDVSDFMATGVQTLKPTDSVPDAAASMKKYGCYHLPVVDDENRLVGLVSDRDVQRALPAASAARPDEAQTVESIMQRDLITITPNTGLRQAAMYLRNQRIGCLPVVLNGKLEGIITDSDFVSIAIELLDSVDEVQPMAL